MREEIAEMGGEDPTAGYALLLILAVGSFLMYFVPALVAFNRGHRQAVPLFIVNLFFGWTLLGWVICLAWAFAARPEKKWSRRGGARSSRREPPQDFSNLG